MRPHGALFYSYSSAGSYFFDPAKAGQKACFDRLGALQHIAMHRTAQGAWWFSRQKLIDETIEKKLIFVETYPPWLDMDGSGRKLSLVQLQIQGLEHASTLGALTDESHEGVLTICVALA